MTYATLLPIDPKTTVKRSVPHFQLLSAVAICLTASGLIVTTATATVSQTEAETDQITGANASLLLSPSKQGSICNILLGLTYFLPIGLGLGIFLHRQYLNYRSAVLRQQIEALERILQKSPGFNEELQE